MAESITPQRVHDYFNEIQTATEAHNEALLEGHRNVAYLEGRADAPSARHSRRHRPGTPPTRVPVNTYNSYFRSMANRLYPKSILSEAVPLDRAYEPGAVQMSAILTRHQKVTGLLRESRYMIGNALLYGWGIAGHGFGGITGGIPDKVYAMLADKEEAEATHRHLERQGIELGDVVGDMVNSATGGGLSKPEVSWARPRMTLHSKVLSNRPWTLSIAPEDLILDWAADSWWSQRYVIHKYYVMTPQLQAMFRELGIKKNAEEIPSWSFEEAFTKGGMEPARGFAWLRRHAIHHGPTAGIHLIYGFWDREHGLWVMLANGLADRALKVKKWPAPTDDFPYNMLSYTDRQGLIYPLSELSFQAQRHDQINLFNTKWTADLARSKRIIAWQAGAAEDEEIDAAKQAPGMSWVKFKQPPDAVLKVVDLTDDPEKYVNALAVLQSQGNVELGIEAEEMGQASRVRGGATQAALIHRGGEAKREFRDFVTREFLEDLTAHQARYIQKCWPLMESSGVHSARDLIGSHRIFRGDTGQRIDGSLFQLEGMSMHEVEHDYRWRVKVDLDTMMAKAQKRQALIENYNITQATGRWRDQEVVEELNRLAGFEGYGFTHPPVDILDPAQEHEALMMQRPIQVQPGEDYLRHFQQHTALIEEAMMVTIMMSQGQEPDMTKTRPMAMWYARHPELLQQLIAHRDETAARLGINPGNPVRSAGDRSADPNLARSSGAKVSSDQQAAAGVVPGAQNQPAGDAMMGGGY